MAFAPFEYYFPSVFPLVASDDEIKKFRERCCYGRMPEENDIEMLIENNVIGKVIGKGGVVVESIRREYGASIKIYDKRFGSKRKVRIYGKYSNVEAAKNEIEKCIAQ
jgi:predicted RNA-binding protein YlqC (UPF0109 family)